jgi:hypothetical protein
MATIVIQSSRIIGGAPLNKMCRAAYYKNVLILPAKLVTNFETRKCCRR